MTLYNDFVKPQLARRKNTRKRTVPRSRTDFRNSLRGLDLEALRERLLALRDTRQPVPGSLGEPDEQGRVHPIEIAPSRQAPGDPDFREDVLKRRVALGENAGFRKDHADLIGKLRELRGQEGADPAVLAALKARRDAKLFGKSQGTFTPDHPEEPTRGTVSPDFKPPKSWGGKAAPSMTKARRDEFLANRRRRRTGTSPGNRGRRPKRDFGIGISRR